MIELPLSQGYTAVIDDCDVDLAQYKWTAAKRRGGRVYAFRNIRLPNGKKTIRLLHREVMGVDDPEIPVDHLDHCGLNCRRYNLEVSTRGRNARNWDPERFPGVYLTKGRWVARIQVDKKGYHLGSFPTREEALSARKAGELTHWGYIPYRRQHG